MSNMFGAQHRALQDQFDTRRLTDMIEGGFVAKEIDDNTNAFIESRDMFFLSSIDHQGRPTVSYKGGDPGFVRVVDKTTIAFPFYDGNGMFYSWGNIATNAKVGLLFIDFMTPNRMRVQGTASVDVNDPLMMDYVEAQGIVRVTIEGMWPNCPRYVHRYTKVKPSRYVPREACETPLAGWKRIDIVQGALPANQQGKAEKAGGLITVEDWFGKLYQGSEEA
ncbi:MAG: pyridoxamine 5'-phosphate oxidase family protein [Betaproteobacteria bacterium]|nr:pyridoxamine 5'-phosphate oxidase family protein [Betaproteobacteria bacterium]